jgi:hypothetical protein
VWRAHRRLDGKLRPARYEIEGEYTAFRGFMPNLIARVMPGTFTKPSQTWLDNFKAFAEHQ